MSPMELLILLSPCAVIACMYWESQKQKRLDTMRKKIELQETS